jgi:hypothetical protein
MPPVNDPIRDQRAARNEDLFRQVNERLHALATLSPDDEPRERFVCECADPGCSVVIELTAAEYRRVRGDETRFVIHPGLPHTRPDVETVVDRCDRFWVVEKAGEAGEQAERLADDGPSLL